jgi:hypothetical protein
MSKQKLPAHEKFAQLAETTRELAIAEIRRVLKRAYRDRGKTLPSCSQIQRLAIRHFNRHAMQ